MDLIFFGERKGIRTMSIMNEIQKELNYTYTENGDIAYISTLNANLDYFGIAGASRRRQDNVLDLFKKAWKEAPITATKNMFYLRDVRGGSGERDSFRTSLGYIIQKEPEIALAFMPYVPEYGRWDDVLLYLENSKTKKQAASFIKKQLEKDLTNKRAGKPISLCSKWMPSVNASSKKTRSMALSLANEMSYKISKYRKMLSELRDGIIVEKNLTERDYSFQYEKLPGRALQKYERAFLRNDKNRFDVYKNELKKGTVQAKVQTLYPHEILAKGCNEWLQINKRADFDYIQSLWNAIERSEDAKNTIVVRDGSGSMAGIPMMVSTAMAILFSEQLTGEFKDKFITFSSLPQLIDLSTCENLKEKLVICEKHRDISNTDISKVYDLLLKASKNITNPKEYIQRVVIISDMEFDYGTENVPTYETMKEKFDKAGIPLPEIVYWNVDARRVHFAAKADQPNIRFVSGMSKNIIDSIINNESVSAYDLMVKTLEKYGFVDKVFEELEK